MPAGLCLIESLRRLRLARWAFPILVAGQVTGLDSFEDRPDGWPPAAFLTIIVLFWIMAIMDGWRGVKRDRRACGDGGGRFVRYRSIPQLKLPRPRLPDIISSLVSLVCLTLFLKRAGSRCVFSASPTWGCFAG